MTLALVSAACPDGRDGDPPRAAPPAAVAAAHAPKEAAPSKTALGQLSAKTADLWHRELKTWRALPLGPRDYVPRGKIEPLWATARASWAEGREGPMVLAFWATYCPPCLQEIPMFDQLFAEGHPVVGISLDSGNAADVQAILERLKPHYPQLILEQASLRAAARTLKTGLPYTLITDREGRPRHGLLGLSNRSRVLAALRSAGSAPSTESATLP